MVDTQSIRCGGVHTSVIQQKELDKRVGVNTAYITLCSTGMFICECCYCKTKNQDVASYNLITSTNPITYGKQSKHRITKNRHALNSSSTWKVCSCASDQAW